MWLKLIVIICLILKTFIWWTWVKGVDWPLIQRLIGVLVITGEQPVLTIVFVITMINLMNRRTTLFAIGVCDLCQPVVTSMLLLVLILDVTTLRLIVEISTSETILVLIYLLLILLILLLVVVRVHDNFSAAVNTTVFIILTILVIAVIIVSIIYTIINEFPHLPCKWLLYKLIIVVVHFVMNVLLPHSAGFMAVLASLARSMAVNNTQVECWCHWLVTYGVIRIHLVRVHIRVCGYRISTLILVIILKSIEIVIWLLLFVRLPFQPPSLLRCLVCLFILLLLFILTIILWLPRYSRWIMTLLLFLCYRFRWIYNWFINLLTLLFLPIINTLLRLQGLWLLFLELPFIVLTCHIVIAVSLGSKSVFFTH